MTNIHSGHRKRLRNLLKETDFSILKDYQILEYLLTITIPRKDTNSLAHELINKFGSLPAVLDSSPEYLMKVPGIGENSAIFLNILPRIMNEYLVRKNHKKLTFKSHLDGVNFCVNLLQGKPKEEIYVILLDNKYNVISYMKGAIGTANSAYITNREISEFAINNNAIFVVLSHNHPTCGPNPSFEDDKFTQSVFISLKLNGIELLDHIIIGNDNSYYSYNRIGKIEEYTEILKSLDKNKNEEDEEEKNELETKKQINN